MQTPFLKFAALVAAATLCAPVLAQEAGKTRAEVKAETRAAVKAGDVTAPGDTGLTERQRYPQDYTAKAKKPKKHKAKKLASTSAQ